MKEQYLTITEMTFLLEGDVLGYGQIIASAPGPERPGELSQSLVQGAIRMGTFLPAGEDVPAGRWEASLEGEKGYALAFRGEKFLLSATRQPAVPAQALRLAES